MKSFIITQHQGRKYRVWMRGAFPSITSQKKLVEALQRSIDGYRERGWDSYADRCQELLDERNFFALDSLWAFFGQTKPLDRR